jgi:transient receptor potential cation channel subfamily A protein 1
MRKNARCNVCSHVNTSILNDKKQAPIHLVTELNKVAVLEVMSKYKDRIDILQGGEHGRTALHLAAIYDYEECARILVSATFLKLYLTLLHFT